MSIQKLFSQKEKELYARMKQLGIHKKNIEEKFIRSSGPGGQNVNKVSTCVFMKHIPSNISVKCSQMRTQAQNRIVAFELLLDKIQRERLREHRRQIQQIERERRKNRKKSKKSKEHMIEDKRRHSKKKQIRRTISAATLEKYL